jgi:futalosine hydrolase
MEVLIAGVGVPDTIFHLQKKIAQSKFDFIIQAGIAGTFNSQFQLAQTVVVKQDTFGDLGMEENNQFTSVFNSGFSDKNKFPFNNGWLINENEIIDELKLPKAVAVTVNKISDNPLQKKQLEDCFHPDIESMEGAALHYICLQEKIPFIQLRSISNEVSIRDKSKWKMKEAIENLNIEIEKLVQHLNK